MSARTGAAPKTPQKLQRELEDLQLVLEVAERQQTAHRRAHPPLPRLRPPQGQLVLPRGDSDDLVQKGMIGLFKAARTFAPDKETSFRSFAELSLHGRSSPRSGRRPLQACALQPRTSPSVTRRPGRTRGDCTLATRFPDRRSTTPRPRHLDRGAAGLVGCLGPDCRGSSRKRSASTSTETPTSTWRETSPATPRRSTGARFQRVEAEDPRAPGGARGSSLSVAATTVPARAPRARHRARRATPRRFGPVAAAGARRGSEHRRDDDARLAHGRDARSRRLAEREQDEHIRPEEQQRDRGEPRSSPRPGARRPPLLRATKAP